MSSISFNRAAEYYDETRGFPAGEEQAVANLFVQKGDLKADSRLLEIGIGTGRIALPLAPHIHSIVGIDIARDMMQQLRNKRLREPIELIEGNAAHLPFPSGSFDAVTAVHVFHLIAEWRETLRELGRVLGPGGLFLLGGGEPSPLRKMLFEAGGPTFNPTVGIRETELHEWLITNDWQAVGAPAVHTYMVNHPPRYYLNQFKARYWSNTWQMTDEELNRRAAEIEAHLLKTYPDPDAPVMSQAGFRVQAYRHG